MPREQVRLHHPRRRENDVVLIPQLVPVLDDAARLNRRQREHLRRLLVALPLFDQLLVRLPGERNNGAVRMNGAPRDCLDVVAAVIRVVLAKLDVRVLLAALRQHLDACVLAPHVQLVVRNLLAVQINRGRAWSLRGRRHLQFVRRGGNPAISMGKSRCCGEEEKRKAEGGTAKCSVH